MAGAGTVTADATDQGWLEVAVSIPTVLLGLAALHPSIVQVDEPTPVTTPEVGPKRLAALAFASLLAPATLFFQDLRGAPLHVPLACATVVCCSCW